MNDYECIWFWKEPTIDNRLIEILNSKWKRKTINK